MEEERDLEEEKLASKRNCKALLWDCLLMEKVEWQQKSRVLWLKRETKILNSSIESLMSKEQAIA